MLEAPDAVFGARNAGAKPARAKRVARAATGSLGSGQGLNAGGFQRPRLTREMGEDFAGEGDAQRYRRGSRFTGLRFRLKGGVPRSVTGRVVAGCVVLGGLIGFTAVVWEARSLLMHDPRLVIASSASIQTIGNSHLTRPQLLSVFGEDVDRNILTVSLAERRSELEQLPWVEHATVMRLLPNKIRVAVVERTPVAFVRQGSHIGLVDREWGASGPECGCGRCWLIRGEGAVLVPGGYGDFR